MRSSDPHTKQHEGGYSGRRYSVLKLYVVLYSRGTSFEAPWGAFENATAAHFMANLAAKLLTNRAALVSPDEGEGVSHSTRAEHASDFITRVLGVLAILQLMRRSRTRTSLVAYGVTLLTYVANWHLHRARANARQRSSLQVALRREAQMLLQALSTPSQMQPAARSTCESASQTESDYPRALEPGASLPPPPVVGLGPGPPAPPIPPPPPAPGARKPIRGVSALDLASGIAKLRSVDTCISRPEPSTLAGARPAGGLMVTLEDLNSVRLRRPPPPTPLESTPHSIAIIQARSRLKTVDVLHGPRAEAIAHVSPSENRICDDGLQPDESPAPRCDAENIGQQLSMFKAVRRMVPSRRGLCVQKAGVREGCEVSSA